MTGLLALAGAQRYDEYCIVGGHNPNIGTAALRAPPEY
jgi:hypothetical protein